MKENIPSIGNKLTPLKGHLNQLVCVCAHAEMHERGKAL